VERIAKIRIEKAADLEDLWGGQHEFEWAVYMTVDGVPDVIGAGHTCAEAVAEARQTLREWR
jgi:hypothetical protein